MDIYTDAKINRIIEMLKTTVSDIPSIAIAGAHAKEMADKDSDIDIYLFTDAPKSFEQRQKIVSEFCDKGTSPWFSEDLNLPWGGSMDFTYEGTPVEVVIRLFSHMESETARSINGEFDIIPQTWTSNGYYSYIFLSELNFIKPLFDPNGRLTEMRKSVEVYPPKLKSAIIKTFFGRAWTWIGNFHYDSAVKRGDILFTAPIVLHTVLDLIQVIFALNEVYFNGDKKLVQTLKTLPYCPTALKEQTELLLTASADTAFLEKQQKLLFEIFYDVKDHLPD